MSKRMELVKLAIASPIAARHLAADDDHVAFDLIRGNVKIERRRTFANAAGAVVMRAVARTIVAAVIASASCKHSSRSNRCHFAAALRSPIGTQPK